MMDKRGVELCHRRAERLLPAGARRRRRRGNLFTIMRQWIPTDCPGV